MSPNRTPRRAARAMAGRWAGCLALGLLAMISPPAHAAPGPDEAPVPTFAPAGPTYGDLVDLTETARLILAVEVRKTAIVDPARAPNLRPGQVRLYIEAQPLTLIAGEAPAAPLIHYLADVPLDARGKPPVLKKLTFLLFARPVPGSADDVQLVAPDAQWPWNPQIEARVRSVLAELAAPGAPSRITGVRELSYVPGTLVGEGETQIFLTTARGEPATISVEHRAGAPVRWNISFSEMVDASGRPPARSTLAWYRLACFLPGAPPAGANISDTNADKAQANADYAFVKGALGPCDRTRR